jgi:hypothetical protein
VTLNLHRTNVDKTSASTTSKINIETKINEVVEEVRF